MNHYGRIIIPAGRKPWPHEIRIAEILAMAGYKVEFLSETSTKTADIVLNGTEYEIKSPLTSKVDKIERNIKRGLKQSENIIIDSSRMKGMSDEKLCRFLRNKANSQKQIKRMIFVNKRGRVIDIKR